MLSWKASSWFLALAPFAQQALAQAGVPYVDPETGIQLSTWTSQGVTLGMALPANAQTTDVNDMIGLLECPITSNGAWCGIAFSGSMNRGPLLTAWAEGDEVYATFRYATGWEPTPYTGENGLSYISSSVNATHFRLLYRCTSCLAWTQDGTPGVAPTSQGVLFLGYALSIVDPTNTECPDDAVFMQHASMGFAYAVITPEEVHAEYSEWAALATIAPPTGTCGSGNPTATGGPTPTPTTTRSPTGTPVPTGLTYDYIVVGAGAGGIPLADKLSEAGNRVLLIEKGPPSSGRWGGRMRPAWLENTNLTRFDVPGLCNQIWVDSAGIACRDTDQMAGCVLGGGTAVNAALWWRPNPTDWDYNFPAGWRSGDMAAATSRVFSRIPGTRTPSTDGQLYLQQGYNLLTGGLSRAGWSNVNPFTAPGSKNRTFTHTPYMYSGGERGGPLGTYLVSADRRSNFDLWMNTSVRRVIRNGGHVTGLEVEPYLDGGYNGIINVTNIRGRVILSAGTFGSAKLLLRSGIGPRDQLPIVRNSTDGPTMINERSWINLPVGYNLEDHTNSFLTPASCTTTSTPPTPIPSLPTEQHISATNRRGILTQSAPNIGPLFFEEIRGSDNIIRAFQYTARVEGNDQVPNGNAMVISQYLGRGAVSRGRMTINRSLVTEVSTSPYLSNTNDLEAVIRSLENVQAALSNVAGLVWHFPPPGQTVRQYVTSLPLLPSVRRANHWIGTNKLSTRDGRQTGGDGVVDLNTKVWGTDNLFVVDASIFPGMVTTNPSSYIVVAAEHAAQRILNLDVPAPAARYSQCGGLEHNGTFQCASGTSCTWLNDYYWQCL
ncbi:hypothetical protein S40285_09344 [Stachybotrys chlorohalonatus IBT 40285]|uniref:CBM1 domain-containing protein n=1 Tax=Stachybotrys chlorohalonatus (strain IBT 40285) TaxID=1283841 RepID=A0A084QKV5_STAC4|nr:hypothetical protein S40285_09344 [Stachybotrys chlorohalonata IBT 40285]